jgi:hypothetical protein
VTVPDRSQTNVTLEDRATGYFAHIQVFNNGQGLVEVSEVPQADLEACAEGRFVPPGGEWQGAAGKLGFFRALILTGGIGSGRRTAALRLLNGMGAGDPIYEIAPTWDQPSTSVLPPLTGARCLLDMSDPTEKPPSADFGKKLLDWANEKKLVLVVMAADETGADRWALSAGSATVPLQSPDARQLAERELGLTAAGEQRPGILDDREFADIWPSAPKAAAVRHLVKLIAEEPFRSPEQIAKEYRGWRTWIEDILPKKKLGSRSLMWAAAFCDGGQRSSVLSMSEDLRRRLKEDRGPAAVLSDDPAAKRLKDAELDPASDRAVFHPSLHGIAEALRVYLWREFADPPVRKLLTDWLIAQLSELPPDDAEHLAQGVLDIVVHYRDDTLLRAVRNQLTGDKQPIAARLLSQAAVDPQFGAHVRSSLYNWAKDSRSQADLVAEVCGGYFGAQMPGLALVRLGWAAQNSGPDSKALASALASIATRHPAAVLDSIAKWIGDKDRATAGINAFLALASGNTGAALLCERSDPATGQVGFRDSLIGWFQRAATESDASYQAAISVYRKWEKFCADGTINAKVAIPVLGRGIEPAFGKNPMRQLHPGFPDMDDFWSQVFTIAIRGKEAVLETDVPDEPGAAPDAPLRQEPQADQPTYAQPTITPPPETASPEASTAQAPTPPPAPEASTWPETRVDALSSSPLTQAVPRWDMHTDMPEGWSPPDVDVTDIHARPD